MHSIMPPTLLSMVKTFGGEHRRYTHESSSCKSKMTFALFLPPGASHAPVVYYLSGLTCSDANAAEKAGLQRTAALLGAALVFPDTSPRHLDIAGEAESWDFGVGAGFYVDATEPKWAGFNMHTYVVDELPALLAEHFQEQLDTKRASVMGHSMGGHGALCLGLRYPERYQSVSAFAPICNPSTAPWGIKAFTGYLGADTTSWAAYDACELMKRYGADKKRLPMLVDWGTCDQNVPLQLKPELLVEAAAAAKYDVSVRRQDGYDHSYYFVATFAEEHLRFHAKALKL